MVRCPTAAPAVTVTRTTMTIDVKFENTGAKVSGKYPRLTQITPLNKKCTHISSVSSFRHGHWQRCSRTEPMPAISLVYLYLSMVVGDFWKSPGWSASPTSSTKQSAFTTASVTLRRQTFVLCTRTDMTNATKNAATRNRRRRKIEKIQFKQFNFSQLNRL